MNNKKAVVYLRVSTDKQADRGLSIPAQRDAIIAYAEREGYKILKEFVDAGESARSADRPQLQEMLSYCKEMDFDAVIVHKLDRLARSTHDHVGIKLILNKTRVKLVSVTENIDESPEGMLMEGVISSFAEYYSRNLGREVLKGMKKRAEEGYWNTRAPMGYRNVSSPGEGRAVKRWIEIDPETGPVIREAFGRFASGKFSVMEISDWLKNKGVTSRSGREIAVSVLCRLFRRTVYIGEIEWGGIKAKGKHEPLVSRDVFIKVQQVLSEHNNGASRNKRHFFVLRGLTWCVECGSRITAEKHLKANGKNHSYYRCSKRLENRPVKCGEKYILSNHLEQEVENALMQIVLPESLIQKTRKQLKLIIKKEASVTKEVVRAHRLHLDRLIAREEKLVQKYLEGRIGDEIYDRMKSSIDEKRKNLNSEVEKGESGLKDSIKVIEKALCLVKDVHSVYCRANGHQKKQLLKILFSRIEVGDGQIRRMVLNPPLDYLCQDLLKNKRTVLFDGSNDGSPKGNRTPISRMKTWRPNH